MRTRSPFHAVTWLGWAVAAAASVHLAPSPPYLVLVLVVTALVVEAHRLDHALARAFPALLALGLAFALLRVALTAVTTHAGSGVWATVPEATLPRVLGGFTVGGTIEGPVVLQAAAEGLAVVAILAVFGAFNAVASHHELLQAAPRAFHEPGLIVTVALAFVPSTMRAVSAVREADRARTGGQVVARGRPVRLVVPLLETGMERAVHLAESMDARGFARLPAGRAERVAGWLGLASLVSLASAFAALVGFNRGLGGGLAGLGCAFLVAAVTVASRGSRPTRYRPRAMSRRDWVTLAVAAGAPLALAVVGAAGNDTLRWSTIPPLSIPRFALAPAAAIALLAAPLLTARPAADGPGTDVQPLRADARASDDVTA